MQLQEGEFSHSGKIGDIIYALPAIRAAGGGKLYLYDDPAKQAQMTKEVADNLRPLLEKQPYIDSVEFLEQWEGPNPDCPLNNFRDVYFASFKQYAFLNLADAHLAMLGFGFEHRIQPWLEVEPIRTSAVVFNRSLGYGNCFFPWIEAVRRYGGKAIFVGTPNEHITFCHHFGRVPYCPTTTLLEVAQVIAGAELFIGNQSAAEAICEGLKKQKILEVSPDFPRSCRFNRRNAIYFEGGQIEWPDV